jgi:hypothetical protein
MPRKKKRINTITTPKSKVNATVTRLEKKISQVAIINEARKLQRTRGKAGMRDALQTGKKSLAPTLHNFKLWAKSPSRYDLRGVDTAKTKKAMQKTLFG